MSALPMADVRAAHAALLALGWDRAKIARVLGHRCTVCLSLTHPHNQTGVCLRCRKVRTVTVTCPACKAERQRRGAQMRIVTCSPECRREMAKARRCGVTP